MRPAIIDCLLGLSILSAWVAAAGFLRLRWALDRLHVVTFTTTACGLPVIVAGFVADGPSIRAAKLLFAWLITLIAGASLNQAVARAIFNRNEAAERT